MTAHPDSESAPEHGRPLRRRRPRCGMRTATTVTTVLAAALALLTGCGMLPGAAGQGGAESGGGGVDFDGVQSATLQIEAQGTFVHPEVGAYEAAGAGSGFLVSHDGLALTNNHVVVGAGTLKVWRDADRSKAMNAKVLGSSECLDLAAIQLEEGDYPYFEWKKGDISTAEEVYAAGYPHGDPDFTMTKGIISTAQTSYDSPWASVDGVIEHDAKIRGGNSGGPLVTPEGELVGVNYAGSDLTDENLAIHRDEVTAVVERLAAGEDVLSLGVNGMGLVDEEGAGLGIWVSSLESGGIADKAGLKPGDLITRMQGVPVGADGTMAAYCDVLRTHGTDSSIDVDVLRPSEGVFYRGKFNGDEKLEPVSVLGDAGGENQATGEYVTVTDDSGRVSVEVPASWTQVDGTAIVDGSTEVQSIIASPDLQAYRSGWAVPGVNVLASQQDVSEATARDFVELMAGDLPGHGCTSAASEDYADGLHTGVYELWENCGPEKAKFLVVGAVADSGEYVVLVAVQAVRESDLDAIDRVIGSFVADYS
ncbi:trypsin-like peptidase domain-containing protein [Leucobacter sp. gxy201]|uniref:S1C family serine protease n=1 Tax=Leucobacter sp. gxy201 TaxID=2957200 RepID=UPI003D9FF6EE